MFPDFRKNNLYIHQVKALDSILANKTTIISTGTGSGKTESFLIPILDYCLRHRDISGLKVIILYPMNALASDQLDRINKAVEGQNIRVASFIGSTPQQQRDSLISEPPDILITNYVMLDRLITKCDTRSMFVRAAHTLHYMIVDEVHSFRGTKGANVCLLLRRLRTLCAHPDQLVQIGASATLRQGGGYYSDTDREQVQAFARTLFGQHAADRFEFIVPIYDDEEGIMKNPDPFPVIDQAIDSVVLHSDPDVLRALASQLAGVSFQPIRPGHKEDHPAYRFAKHNQFVQVLLKKLKSQACTIDELQELFQQVYYDNHQRHPRYAREMVNAYLGLLNEMNRHSILDSSSVPEVLLDYRLHLILTDIGGHLTRCLGCGHYHDSQRSHCRFCNGLLFRVSDTHPELCLARCDGKYLFPQLQSEEEEPRNIFSVLIQLASEHTADSETRALGFTVEPEEAVGEERYLLHAAPVEHSDIWLFPLPKEASLKSVELKNSRYYWQNVQQIIDAVLMKPETKTASKLLGFIDNREKASGIRFRLRDEIAERALTTWAAREWSSSDGLPLLKAYHRLEQQAHHLDQDISENARILYETLRELPFWFARMLTNLDQYLYWHIYLNPVLSAQLQTDERLLLEKVFLESGVIDRTDFGVVDTQNLSYFFIEKYRVATEFGIGLSSASEHGYTITSLGPQGRNYQEVITQLGSERIATLLPSLADRGVLRLKQTRGGVSFYQLNPSYVMLKCIPEQCDTLSEMPNAMLVECHTSDHDSKTRDENEKKFKAGEIQALICTPTLEMGIDIGDLSCVMMIGFPPSPANYTQRAGRAGRKSGNHLATIPVLAFSGNVHDEYYAANPRAMIEGMITPPQLTLTNMKLLAAHAYAHILAGDTNLSLLRQIEQFKLHVEQFINTDELDLQSELGEEYRQFAEYLREDSKKLSVMPGLRNLEDGYKRGVFPDYGFRRDGVPLIEPDQDDRDDSDSVLTAREPEEAVRKLIPGQVVYCSGRPVRVDSDQLADTYRMQRDPFGNPFRAYTHLRAEKEGDWYIYAKPVSPTIYRLQRTLHLGEPMQELPASKPTYSQVQLVRKGKLYIVNEGVGKLGEFDSDPPHIQAFQDDEEDYRIGTLLERDGLLITFGEQIVSLDDRANFLAILLRSIPDYFYLDDGELRVEQPVKLYFPEGMDRERHVFMYGHDESGLIPFDRIFEHLREMLEQRLLILENCQCEDGCYRCLFSYNSQYLVGVLSRHKAATFLRAYLQLALLQPHITFSPPSSQFRPDVTLQVLWRNRCEVTAHNYLTNTRQIYSSNHDGADQNTVIYTTVQSALAAEAAAGGRTVKLQCKPAYIDEQLRGKAKVDKGQEAFGRLMLNLRSWDAWTSERMP